MFTVTIGPLSGPRIPGPVQSMVSWPPGANENSDCEASITTSPVGPQPMTGGSWMNTSGAKIAKSTRTVESQPRQFPLGQTWSIKGSDTWYCVPQIVIKSGAHMVTWPRFVMTSVNWSMMHTTILSQPASVVIWTSSPAGPVPASKVCPAQTMLSPKQSGIGGSVVGAGSLDVIGMQMVPPSSQGFEELTQSWPVPGPFQATVTSPPGEPLTVPSDGGTTSHSKVAASGFERPYVTVEPGHTLVIQLDGMGSSGGAGTVLPCITFT